MSRAKSSQAAVLCALFALGTSWVGAQERPFVRGDVNQDEAVNIADATALLLYLFSSSSGLPCEKAADVDDSGSINISDAIYALDFLFGTGAPPPSPAELCGPDPTPDTLTCAASPCEELSAHVVISEVMASNNESLADEDGDREDWIEIQIAESSLVDSVDLSGWYLTDDAESLTKWRFPDGVTLEQGDYMIIFASGKDRAVAESELHTNFKLARDGQYLGLVAPDGVSVVDALAPAYPEQLPDVSYGRVRSRTVLVGPGHEALYYVPRGADSGLGSGWTAPDFDAGNWKTGETGLGFSGIGTTTFEVTTIKSAVPVDHISVAEDILNDPRKQLEVVTESASVIDFLNTGESGNYPGDAPFPGVGEDDEDDYVVHITGMVVIPRSGVWTFGVNSDDGFRLELSGSDETHSFQYQGTREPRTSVRVLRFPEAGPYELSLLYFERTGGAGLELFAAQGSRLAFNAATFRLVGDTSRNGLALLGLGADIETDVTEEMDGINSSLWTRMDFDVEDPSRFGGLALLMKYADGFVAYLNGHEVARRNAPSSLRWNSSATSPRFINDVSLAETVNLTNHLGKLVEGGNVLAIHALNDARSDADFLVQPELVATGRVADLVYMTAPTPGALNVPGAVDFVRDVRFSVERGFFDTQFLLELTSETPEARIRYTLDGSTPTATTGRSYDAPISVSSTSVIRAAAFKPDHLDSGVTTRSYIFAKDVIYQSPNGQRPGPGWPSSGVNGQDMDYGMDPEIVNSSQWSPRMRDALLQIPSISLVTDLPNLFSSSTGIYVNARNDGRAWERRTSVELVHPDGTEGFGVDAGLRIRGAFSRSGNNPKHSFRLIFRTEYGAGKLKYPLFGGEGVDEFDRIDLRTSQNYSWAFSDSTRNTFLRDVFSRDVMRDMGQPYTRSRYYHLYLNGQYWGLYQTEERADADFAASYLGGKDGHYDVIKNNSSGNRALHPTDGTMDAYRRLYDAARRGFSSDAAYFEALGLLPNGTLDPGGERLLDAQNLMDYMICTYYTGDPDAPVSVWGNIANNVFAIYNRKSPQGFTWYRHDAEHSLGANGGLHEKRLLTDSQDRSIGQQWQWFNPAWLHLQLTEHPEYLLEFADRVNRHFSNGGLLTPEANVERWSERARQINLAVIAASARWGDSKSSSPRTKNHWSGEVSWVQNSYFPRRTEIVLEDMRSVGMFPEVALVSFNRHGGEVEPGFRVTMTQGNGTTGTIHYTLDGSDPREWGGGISPSAVVYGGGFGTPILLTETTTVRARVRDGDEWGALTEARFTIGVRGLVINEVMASNRSTLEDPDEPGEFPDWIELYNGSSEAIDLGGMYLTDDLIDLTHWQIAPGVTIGPGEHLVFFADDDGTQGPLHTNFQLSRNGETVALVDADGRTVIDSIEFDRQTTDVSYGRATDGDSSWSFHEAPSPGGTNE